MNERIEKLLEQCQIETYGVNGELLEIGFDAEKFALLIVAECMDLASKEQKRYASITHRNMSECAVALGNFSLLMKDHFEDEQ
jgi:hypothetical protein